MAETIGVNLTGSADGFVSAINSAVASMDRFEKKAESLGSVGTFLKRTVLPVATAIGSAFAANKALSIFSESDLPGAKAYKEAVDNSKKSVTQLAAAVGEYLAPAATKVANAIKSIADWLTPLVRQFTAFSASATEFLFALAGNLGGALRFLMPTVDAIMSKVEGMFNGPAHDWAADIEAFREVWNDTWSAILEFSAPIIVQLAETIDATLNAVGQMAAAALESLSEALASILPASEQLDSNFSGLAETIQSGIVKALAIAEYAITNWRDTARLAVEYVMHYFSQIGSNFGVIWDNALLGMEYFANEVKTIFTLLFGADGYVVALLKETFLRWLPDLLKNSVQAVGESALAITTGGTIGDVHAPKMPGFQMPQIYFGRRDKPNYQSMPGIKSFQSDMGNSFATGLSDFLDQRIPKVSDQAGMFVDAVKFMLPDVTAKVNDYVVGNPITRDSESTKQTGLAMEGSKEAYKAILAMENRSRDEALEVAKAQLNEQKKLNDKVGGMGLAAGAIP